MVLTITIHNCRAVRVARPQHTLSYLALDVLQRRQLNDRLDPALPIQILVELGVLGDEGQEVTQGTLQLDVAQVGLRNRRHDRAQLHQTRLDLTGLGVGVGVGNGDEVGVGDGDGVAVAVGSGFGVGALTPDP